MSLSRRCWLILVLLLMWLIGACSIPGSADPATPAAPETEPTAQRTGSLPAPPVPTRLPLPVRTSVAAAPTARSLPTALIPTPTLSLEQLLVPTPTPEQTAAIPTPTFTPVAAVPAATPTPILDYDAWRPHSYRARGSFVTTTTFADGTETRQQGEFEIVIASTDSSFGTDEFYRLVSVRDDGGSDTIVVYRIGGYILVNLGDGIWQVTPREQGSPFVETLAAVLELPDAFRDGLANAETMAEGEIAGVPVTRYRFTDADEWTGRFVSPGSSPGATVEAATFEVWYAGRAGFAMKYVFTSSLTDARALDASFREVAVDQAVAWTFEVFDVDAPIAIGWPADAPLPGTIQPPGFAVGEFPAPPDAVAEYDDAGAVELVTALDPDATADFYRRELDRLGWSMEGNFGLYAVRKGEVGFTLALARDEETDGTRISVLVGEE